MPDIQALAVATIVDKDGTVNPVGTWEVYDTGLGFKASRLKAEVAVASIDDWQPTNAYNVGEEFTAVRNSDGKLWLYQVPAGFTGLSGAAFDATEEARYTAVGEYIPPTTEWVNKATSESPEKLKTNFYAVSETVGVAPALTAGEWYAVVQPNALGEHLTSVYYHDGTAVQLIQGVDPKVPIRRYTADGPISDEDQLAIFETGAVNMTISTTTTDRKIAFYRASPVDVNIVDQDGKEFTVKDPTDETKTVTTTDQTVIVNQPLSVATIINNGSGWDVSTGDNTAAAVSGRPQIETASAVTNALAADYVFTADNQFFVPDITTHPTGRGAAQLITVTVKDGGKATILPTVGGQTINGIGTGVVAAVAGQTVEMWKAQDGTLDWTLTPRNFDATVNPLTLTEQLYNVEGLWLGVNQRYTQVVTWPGTTAGTHNFSVAIDPVKVIKVDGMAYHSGVAWALERNSLTAGMIIEIIAGGAGLKLSSYGGYNPQNGGIAVVHYYK